MAFATKKRLPAWAYGAIAAIPAATLASWAQLDQLSRIELLIPALFWGGAFIIISLPRRATRS